MEPIHQKVLSVQVNKQLFCLQPHLPELPLIFPLLGAKEENVPSSSPVLFSSLIRFPRTSFRRYHRGLKRVFLLQKSEQLAVLASYLTSHIFAFANAGLAPFFSASGLCLWPLRCNRFRKVGLYKPIGWTLDGDERSDVGLSCLLWVDPPKSFKTTCLRSKIWLRSRQFRIPSVTWAPSSGKRRIKELNVQTVSRVSSGINFFCYF